MKNCQTSKYNEMNKIRRNELEKIISELEGLKERIDVIAEDEQDARDNLPESMEYSERAENMDENVSDLENSSSSIQDIIDEILTVIER